MYFEIRNKNYVMYAYIFSRFTILLYREEVRFFGKNTVLFIDPKDLCTWQTHMSPLWACNFWDNDLDDLTHIQNQVP